MNTWQDLVVQIVVGIVALLFAYLGNVVVKNKKAVSLIQVIQPLAEAAVVAAEKLGVTESVTGAVKKSAAVADVKSELAKLGFTTVDETTVANAVESAFASMKGLIESTYNDKGTEDTGKAEPQEPTKTEPQEPDKAEPQEPAKTEPKEADSTTPVSEVTTK